MTEVAATISSPVNGVARVTARQRNAKSSGTPNRSNT